jgi:hypothetical protein
MLLRVEEEEEEEEEEEAEEQEEQEGEETTDQIGSQSQEIKIRDHTGRSRKMYTPAHMHTCRLRIITSADTNYTPWSVSFRPTGTAGRRANVLIGS